MAIAYKVLGQVNPTANVMTQLYSVPIGANTIISTLAICNQSAAATSFSVTVQPGGAGVTSQSYIMYNTPLAGYDTITLTMGITLGSTDIVSVNSFSSTTSITAFGSEIR